MRHLHARRDPKARKEKNTNIKYLPQSGKVLWPIIEVFFFLLLVHLAFYRVDFTCLRGSEESRGLSTLRPFHLRPDFQGSSSKQRGPDLFMGLPQVQRSLDLCRGRGSNRSRCAFRCEFKCRPFEKLLCVLIILTGSLCCLRIYVNSLYFEFWIMSIIN